MSGRGETRRQATGWQAERTKAEWAEYAAELEAENFKLAAHQCPHSVAGEHGDTAKGCLAYDRDGLACLRLCKAEDEIERLRAALREIRGWREIGRDDRMRAIEEICDAALLG